MANYEEVKKTIREKINCPENNMRGITEATGLRILDGIYMIVELLRQKMPAEQERGIQVARPRGTDSAQVIHVIKTEALRGEGTKEDMCRTVDVYKRQV